MNGYEKLIKIMKEQSNQSDQLFLTEMDSSDSCSVNGLKLERDDLLIAHHLTTGWLQSGDTYIEPLQKGDLVVVVRLNETKYAILERVV